MFMMRILLIGPTTSDSYYQRKGRVYPPMGIYRMKFWMEHRYPVHVDVVNSELTDPWDYLMRHAKRYDIIGVSSLHATLENDISVMLTARKLNPDATLIAGGMEATFNSEQILEYVDVDYVCRGEGELFLESIYCRGEPPEPQFSRLSELEFNFATLMMDYNQMDVVACWMETKRRHPTAKNIRTVRIFTESRCPRKCRYCAATNLPVSVNYLWADTIIKMVERSLPLNPELILLHGDNFLLGSKARKRLEEFGDWKSPVRMMCQCDVRDVDQDKALRMKEIGIESVSLGVENWSDNVLRDFGKRGLSQDRINEVIEILLDAGIEVFCNVILTSPNTTFEDIKENLEWINHWYGRGVEFGINLYPQLFPGTEYARMVEEGKIGYHVPVRTMIPRFNLPITKLGKLLPMDEDVREVVLRVERRLEQVRLPTDKLSEVILEEVKKVV